MNGPVGMTLWNRLDPKNFECPHCHSPNVIQGQRPNKMHYVQCADCQVSIESASVPIEKIVHLFEKEDR